MKTILITILLLSVLSLYSATRIFSVSQLQNGECQPIGLNHCVHCQTHNGTYYYQAYTNSQSTYVYAYEYSDPDCIYYRGYVPVYEETQCAPNITAQCSIFTQTESISYFELRISSETPIKATFLGDEEVHATISERSLVARSDSLQGVMVRNDDARFRFEKIVSPSQYSSTFGVYHFGELYTAHDFKFSVHSVNVSAMNYNYNNENNSTSNSTESLTYVAFSPFISVSVSGSEEYEFLCTSDDEFIFKGSSLSGLTVSNPIYGIQNLSLYPDFHLNNRYYDANVVFQLEASSSPYFTKACYHSASEIRGNDVDLYFCEFSSLSVSWGSFGSWGSWSFDWHELERKDATRPDHMAFSLF